MACDLLWPMRSIWERYCHFCGELRNTSRTHNTIFFSHEDGPHARRAVPCSLRVGTAWSRTPGQPLMEAQLTELDLDHPVSENLLLIASQFSQRGTILSPARVPGLGRRAWEEAGWLRVYYANFDLVLLFLRTMSYRPPLQTSLLVSAGMGVEQSPGTGWGREPDMACFLAIQPSLCSHRGSLASKSKTQGFFQCVFVAFMTQMHWHKGKSKLKF